MRKGRRSSGFARSIAPAVALLAAFLAASSSPADIRAQEGSRRPFVPLLRTLTGETRPARLSAVEEDGYRFLAGPGVAEAIFPEENAEGVEAVVVKDDDLIRFGLGVDRPRQPLVSLVDGSIVAGELVALGGQTLMLDSRLYGELSIPIELIRGIALRPPYDGVARDELHSRIAKYDGSDDAIELVDGLTAQGVWSAGPSGAAPSAPVPFGTRIDRFFLETVSAEEPIEYPRERVRAIFVAPAARATFAEGESAYAWWGFDDGTLLRIASRTIDGEAVRATLACGLDVSIDREEILSKLVLIESAGTRAKPLSGLEPQAYRQTPLSGRELRLGIDESTVAGRLRAGGGYVMTGIGMHARSRVVFAFDRTYRRFQAELAIEDSAVAHAGKPGGSVVGSVYALKDGNWSRVVESPIVRGGDVPFAVNADVSGAQALMLTVEEADAGDVLDRAVWLDARLVP